jgi:hypothetical protein
MKTSRTSAGLLPLGMLLAIPAFATPDDPGMRFAASAPEAAADAELAPAPEGEELVVEPYSEGMEVASATAAPNAEAEDQPAVARTEMDMEAGEDEEAQPSLGLNYFAIFYGPSVRRPTAYQPLPGGGSDTDRPVLLKNFVGLSYYPSDKVTITPTAYFTWEPLLKQRFAVQDPFLKISHNSLINTGSLTLYGDGRIHVPVSKASRDADIRGAVQSVQVMLYNFGGSSFTAGVYASEKAYIMGRKPGYDLELYLGPNLAWRLFPSLSATVLYEMRANHIYGDKMFSFTSDIADLEPGLSWDIAEGVNWNPYLTIYTGKKVNWDAVAFGMTLSVDML